MSKKTYDTWVGLTHNKPVHEWLYFEHMKHWATLDLKGIGQERVDMEDLLDDPNFNVEYMLTKINTLERYVARLKDNIKGYKQFIKGK